MLTQPMPISRNAYENRTAKTKSWREIVHCLFLYCFLDQRHCTCWVPDSKKRCPSSQRKSRSQSKIPRIWWNSMADSRIKKGPPLVLIMSQVNPLQSLQTYFYTIHIGTILPPITTDLKWSPSFRFTHWNYVRISFLSHTCRILLDSSFHWIKKRCLFIKQ